MTKREREGGRGREGERGKEGKREREGEGEGGEWDVEAGTLAMYPVSQKLGTIIR
jgi:hypothetical protein